MEYLKSNQQESIHFAGDFFVSYRRFWGAKIYCIQLFYSDEFEKITEILMTFSLKSLLEADPEFN